MVCATSRGDCGNALATGERSRCALTVKNNIETGSTSGFCWRNSGKTLLQQGLGR